MTQLVLPLNEWENFKNIAKFIYEFTISKGNVIIMAESKYLEPLGY